MRLLLWIFITIGAVALSIMGVAKYETDYTRKADYSAQLVEKWEDWSREGENYRAFFNVQVRDKLVGKETHLTAKTYAKAVPADSFSWNVKASPEWAGATPTVYELQMKQAGFIYQLVLWLFYAGVTLGLLIWAINDDF